MSSSSLDLQQTPSFSLMQTSLKGMNLLDTPILNKGTAFTEDERQLFGLDGLLPPEVCALDCQLDRTYQAYQRCSTDLDRHVYLRALQDRNEVLFYALMRKHITEMTPMGVSLCLLPLPKRY